MLGFPALWGFAAGTFLPRNFNGASASPGIE
jgi:hypothetical protein